MFHPMALTVIFALVGAFVLSLTFVPAMVALLIRGKVTEKEMFLVRWVKAVYRPVINFAVWFRWPVVAASVVAFLGSLVLFTRLGQEFVPQLDEKDLALQALRIPSTSLTQAQDMQFDLERVITGLPEVLFVFSKTGTAELASDPMPPNATDTFVIFKPKEEWRSESELDRLIASKEAEVAKLSEGHAAEEEEEGPKLEGHKGKLLRLIELTVQCLPGNKYEFTQPIQMRFNELIAGVRGDVAVKVFGDDFERIGKTALQIASVLQGVAGAADVKVEQTEGLPVLTVEVDRVAMERYGLSVAQVQEVVAIAMGGKRAGLVFEGDRRFDIVVRLPESIRAQMDLMERLPIPLPRKDEPPEPRLSALSSDAGISVVAPHVDPGFVPLGAVAKVTIAEGVNQVSRENGKRRVVVQANIRGRDLGSFITEAQAKVARVPLPAGSWLTWGGQFENLVAAKERLSMVVPACFLLILLLLFSTFKSLRYALLVFSAVPLGLTGGIVTLWLRDMPFSISAAVGFIALSGVAVLNGLVMVSFINQLRASGLSRDKAIMEGCLVRVRPVLMTALVASLGFVPMALARGTGAEVQRPLATVVIGGLVTSTALTLIVLPALYRIFTGRSGVMTPTTQPWEAADEGATTMAVRGDGPTDPRE